MSRTGVNLQDHPLKTAAAREQKWNWRMRVTQSAGIETVDQCLDNSARYHMQLFLGQRIERIPADILKLTIARAQNRCSAATTQAEETRVEAARAFRRGQSAHDEAEPAQIGAALRPAGRRQEPDFLLCLAQRGSSKRPGKGGGIAGAATRGDLFHGRYGHVVTRLEAIVVRLDPPARKHQNAGQENMPARAPAHQNARLIIAVIQDHQARRIARGTVRGLSRPQDSGEVILRSARNALGQPNAPSATRSHGSIYGLVARSSLVGSKPCI